MEKNWKRYIPNLIIFAVFALASAIYFVPALEGKIIYSGDGINGRAAVQESVEYHEKTGDYTFWTNSMFSGMPNYQIGGNGGYVVDKIFKPLRWFFAWGNRNAFFIFLFYLCAFFLLLRAFDVGKWLSMAGAFAISLSSYFFVIIAASHHGKCYSITWMTLVVVGFLLIYRKQYGWGALITAFFTYIGFFLHPQMSYYICMMIGVFFFAELAIAIRDKQWRHLAIATAVFAFSFALGMGMGSANIFANQEYAAETMRGGHSDLAKQTDADNKTGGLDLDYATAWSYGIDETMTFLIPNYMGGASGYDLGGDSSLEKELRRMGVPKQQARQFCKSAPVYHGEKAFTSGPVYMGAIVCMLFILGLLIVPGPYKWALLAATLFSVLLSWGHNMMWLTELFFRYFPMYNKFRAVESILIVAEITVPLLAMLSLREVAAGRVTGKRLRITVGLSAAITALICICVVIRSGFIDMSSSYDASWKNQVGEQIYDAILSERRQMMTSDAWRSLMFVLLGAAAVIAYDRLRQRGDNTVSQSTDGKADVVFAAVLTVLIVADMWGVDKRFCNDSYFHPRKDVFAAFKARPFEKQLLDADKGYYRVLDLSTNTFNDARISYYFNSVGGYSAAKLRRYQDLIDEHISKMNWRVLNMLNTKYLIVKNRETGQPYPHYNPDAMGACWLVDSIQWVGNANAESDALNYLDLSSVAVADSTLAANSGLVSLPANSNPEDYIELVSHTPNRLTYKSVAATERLAVLSEIYYPNGWKATLDGKSSADIYRVNYMLRAVVVPAGEHELVLTFEPDSVRKGNILSVCCMVVLLLMCCAVVGRKIYLYRKSMA